MSNSDATDRGRRVGLLCVSEQLIAREWNASDSYGRQSSETEVPIILSVEYSDK
jgi:hypothetical protein